MSSDSADRWPALPYDAWKPTYQTLHLWTQVVGKIALAAGPPLNHSWGIAFHLTPRGLTTLPLWRGARMFTIEFDFVAHRLVVRVAGDAERIVPLVPQSVASFYREVMAALDALGLSVRIWPVSVEMPVAIRLDADVEHASYDAAAAERWWRILARVARVMNAARCTFIGKCSPVHFFWGSFDLAVTRFSGRPAPPRDGPAFMRDAYSHEVISHGFWPGNDAMPEPVFYAYAVPEPDGFKTPIVEPAEARYDAAFGEFVLPYDAVRTATDPDRVLRRFIDSTYATAASKAHWNREALERREA